MTVQLSTICSRGWAIAGIALAVASCRTAPRTRTGPEDPWERLGSDQKFKFFLAGRGGTWSCPPGKEVCYKGTIEDVGWLGGCMWPGFVSLQRNRKELEQKISQFCPSGQRFNVTKSLHQSCRTLFAGKCTAVRGVRP